ncbi:MAG: TOMM system kinase/cyclase fusion protein [Bacteroidota bacterium]
MEKQSILPKTTVSALENYHLLEPIGEGGYGTVFKAQQLRTGRQVAIKRLKAREDIDASTKTKQIARFERETQLVAELHHPHIVQLLDKGFDEQELPFAVFEFVEGKTLKNYLLDHGSLSAAAMAPLMSQLLDALVTAHEAGIVHRDLKPQNIMVTQTGAKPYVKILDFGIAAFTQEYRTADYRTLTFTKDVVGTPTYSAPEQLRGESPTPKSDLYAWGLILLECLTGVPIMEGESIGQVFQKQLAPTPVPLPPALLDHPLGLLMRRVLEKNPRNRVADTQGLLQDFEAINFNTLSGALRSTVSTLELPEEVTVDNQLGYQAAIATRKQITVLCMQLQLEVVGEIPIELEVLDALQKDQLQLCRDTAQRYGGTVSDSFMNHLAVYFGYPESTDTDARRAGKAALELMHDVAQRSQFLEEQHGLKAHLWMGMHSGTVLAQQGVLPEGAVPMIAFALAQQAKNGVLISESSERLLAPFFDSKPAGAISSLQSPQEITTFALTKERESETGTALRPWSAERPMVGRDAEKTEALAAWGRAQGQGQALILHGQAGIGKSKLTHEVKQAVRELGDLVRECRCLPEHQNNALYPFLTMLQHHWGIHSAQTKEEALQKLAMGLEQSGETAAESLPLFASWLNLPFSEEHYTQLSQTPEEQKALLFAALHRILSSLDATKPFLLVLEDLHWLDPTSTEFVTQFLPKLSGHHLLFLMTTRPNFQNPWDAGLYTKIDLEELPETAVGALVRSTLAAEQVDDKVVAYILDRTDGIPLFVEEMASMLQESKYLELQDGRYQLVENIEEQAIPSTLADLLNARLDRMASAKETAQMASAIGREFDYDLLLKASNKTEDKVLADLDQLTQADLVYRQKSGQGAHYIFRHALIRDAAYDGMVTAHRQVVHGSIANTIEVHFPEMLDNTPMEPARHYAGAGNHGRATELGNTAIQKQVTASGNQEARAISGTVRTWIGELPDQVLKLKRTLDMGVNVSPAVMTLDGYGSKGLIEQAEEIETAVQQLDRLDRLDILIKLREVAGDLASSAELSQWLDQHTNAALQEGEPMATLEARWQEAVAATDHPTLSTLWENWQGITNGTLYPDRADQLETAAFYQWLSYHYRAEHQKASELGDEQLARILKKMEAAQQAGDDEKYHQLRIFIQGVYVHLAQAHFFVGRLLKGIELWEAGDDLYNQATDEEAMRANGMNTRCHFLILGSLGYFYRGQPKKGLQYLKEGLAYATDLADQSALGLAYDVLLMMHHRLNDWDTLKAEGQKMYETIKRENYTAYQFIFPEMILHSFLGEPQKAGEKLAGMIAQEQKLAVAYFSYYAAEGYMQLATEAEDRMALLQEGGRLYTQARQLNEETGEWIETPMVRSSAGYSYHMFPAIFDSTKEAGAETDRLLEEAISLAEGQAAWFNALDAHLYRMKVLQDRKAQADTTKHQQDWEAGLASLRTLMQRIADDPVAETDYFQWYEAQNLLHDPAYRLQTRFV